ncbi:MAG: tyrosine-type recombinase/integrase [Oceanococcaceae bacterium]
MPKRITTLSDVDCRNLRHTPGSRAANRLRDGGGLWLEAMASGRKVWRLRYRGPAGENVATMTPDYGKKGGGLADARRWRDSVKDLLADGIDPNQHAKAQEQARHAQALATFAATADEWRQHKAPGWSESQRRKIEGIIRVNLLPWLGSRPVSKITAQELLHCLQHAEKRGRLETAHRARECASAIFRRAVLLGLRTDDPAAALKGALQPKRGRNMAHLTDPEEIGGLLRAIDGFTGSPEVALALRLLPLVFTRPTELRAASWAEIDLDAALWTIPAERMKMRRPHVVPLSEQALALLRELEPLTRHSKAGLLFPGRDRRKPISEAAMNAALRRMGYTTEQQTPHGFRHIASTRLHELGWDSRVVELQLAHADKNTIRGIYNKAEHLPDRARMMQAWADHLDALKDGKADKVRPIRAAGSTG